MYCPSASSNGWNGKKSFPHQACEHRHAQEFVHIWNTIFHLALELCRKLRKIIPFFANIVLQVNVLLTEDAKYRCFVRLMVLSIRLAPLVNSWKEICVQLLSTYVAPLIQHYWIADNIKLICKSSVCSIPLAIHETGRKGRWRSTSPVQNSSIKFILDHPTSYLRNWFYSIAKTKWRSGSHKFCEVCSGLLLTRSVGSYFVPFIISLLLLMIWKRKLFSKNG